MKTRKRKRKPNEEQRQAAGLALDEFLTDAPKAPRTKNRKPAFDLALSSAKIRSASGEWEKTSGRVFVGLYAMCHEIVYGLLPDELRPDAEMRKASRLAKRCLDNHFDGDADAMVLFIKWTWERQKSKEAWALSQGRQINRLSAWAQFSGGLVTDYRKAELDKARRRKRGR